MSIKKTLKSPMELIKLIKHENKLFLDEYLTEFISFLIFGLTGGIIAYFISEHLIHLLLDGLEEKPELQSAANTVKILISILLAVIIGSLYLPYYVFFTNKFAFSHLFKIRGDNLNPDFRKSILNHYENRINEQLISLSTLTKQGEIKADYYTQYFFARMFSETANNYFWATSFDKPSEFPIRNISYLQQFEGMQLNGLIDADIPKKARVFITTYSDLIKDIAENRDYLLQLLKMHLHYDTDQVICSVRFFICTDNTFQEAVDIVKTDFVNPSAMIYDFFVIDDTLVYGRKNKKLTASNDDIYILFIGNQKLLSSKSPIEIDSYKNIFKAIWHKSYDIKALASLLEQKSLEVSNAVTNLASAQIVSEEKIYENINRFRIDALAYYDNIKNTESTNSRYSSIFQGERVGEGFFNKWLELIKNSKGFAWAVDSSERKEGEEFYRIWDNNKDEDFEYRMFFQSSMACSKSNECNFKRIFIIKNKIPQGDLAFFTRFLIKSVEESNMKVGVIVSEESDLDEAEKLNLTDFIIIDINQTGSTYYFDNAKGFTLRNEKFNADILKYTENLILVEDFIKHQNIFEKLWHNEHIVLFETTNHITDTSRINRLIQQAIK